MHATDRMMERLARLADQYRKGLVTRDDYVIEASYIVEEEGAAGIYI